MLKISSNQFYSNKHKYLKKYLVFFCSVLKILKPWFQLDPLATEVTHMVNHIDEANIQGGT